MEPLRCVLAEFLADEETRRQRIQFKHRTERERAIAARRAFIVLLKPCNATEFAHAVQNKNGMCFRLCGEMPDGRRVYWGWCRSATVLDSAIATYDAEVLHLEHMGDKPCGKVRRKLCEFAVLQAIVYDAMLEELSHTIPAANDDGPDRLAMVYEEENNHDYYESA